MIPVPAANLIQKDTMNAPIKPPSLYDLIRETFGATQDRDAAARKVINLLYSDKALYKSVCDDLLNAAVRDLVNKECGRQKRAIEKKMAAAVGLLDIGHFIAEVSGFSPTQMACIVGEAGDLANYANPAKLWKRMGLAVINGERQSKQSDKAKAFDHGYNPSRRSAMWNIGESLIKAQVRSVKDGDGEKTGESTAIGALGFVYLERKHDQAAKHPNKTKAHIHNDAKRYMEKRLLLKLWRAWNQ